MRRMLLIAAFGAVVIWYVLGQLMAFAQQAGDNMRALYGG